MTPEAGCGATLLDYELRQSEDRAVTRQQRASGDKRGEAGEPRREQERASEHRERRGGRLGGKVGQGLDSEHITGERLWSGHRGSVKPRRPPLRLRGAGRSGLRALICAHVCVSVETGLQILGSDSSSHVHLGKRSLTQLYLK